MVDMVSMKRSPAELEEAKEPVDFEPEAFPTTLYLGDDEVEKLGLEGAQVGDQFALMGNVKVTSVSAHDSERGDKHHSVTLAFTEAGVEKPPSKSQAERMFPDQEG